MQRHDGKTKIKLRAQVSLPKNTVFTGVNRTSRQHYHAIVSPSKRASHLQAIFQFQQFRLDLQSILFLIRGSSRPHQQTKSLQRLERASPKRREWVVVPLSPLSRTRCSTQSSTPFHPTSQNGKKCSAPPPRSLPAETAEVSLFKKTSAGARRSRE